MKQQITFLIDRTTLSLKSLTRKKLRLTLLEKKFTWYVFCQGTILLSVERENADLDTGSTGILAGILRGERCSCRWARVW